MLRRTKTSTTITKSATNYAFFQNTQMMISLFVLFAHFDPTFAESVKRSTSASNEPYGIQPPVYPFQPHPTILPAQVVLSKRPIICNNETEYECVCMKPFISEHSPPPNVTKPDCSVFIKSDDLPVVDMRIRHFNSEGKTALGMTYELYLKTRIASLVSQYCQFNMNDCEETQVRLTNEVIQSLTSDEIDDLDKSVLYAERDEYDPLFTKRSIVFLRMDHLQGNVTRILLVIRKTENTGGIVDVNQIIDPVKVKYILGSSVLPLTRALGGVRLESVRVSRLKRNEDFVHLSYASPQQRLENGKDNSRLITGLLIVCAFFLTTYCIACVQCVRYFYRKHKNEQQAKLAESGLAATADCRNYGTCEKQRKPSRNGHVHVEERIPLTYEPIDENANQEPQPLTQRQMRNWFTCDSSQLPREPTVDRSLYQEPMEPAQKEESPILTKREAPAPPQSNQSPADVMFPPSKDFSDYVEDQFHKSRTSSSSPDQEIPKSPQEDPWDELGPLKNAPPVVLLQSETPDIPMIAQIILDETDSAPKKARLSSDSPTFARPRSRRGSRIDEEEGTLDIPDLKPLHSDDPLEEPMEVPVPPELIKKEVDEEDRWSSSEEGDVDVYYKMSDEEDVTREELDWRKSKTKTQLEQESHKQGAPLPGGTSFDKQQQKKSETPPSSPIQTNDNIDTDSEDEDIMEQNNREPAETDEAFLYERLREELSPHPPIVVDLDTIDLDLEPIKAMPPPPPHGPTFLPDSPPESGSDNNYLQNSHNSSDDEDSLR